MLNALVFLSWVKMAAVLPPQSNNDRSCDSTNNDAIHARRIRALEMAQRPKMPTPACLVDSKKKCILQTSDFDEVDEYIKLVRSSTLESDGQKVIDIMTPGMKDGYGNPFLTFIDEPIVSRCVVYLCSCFRISSLFYSSLEFHTLLRR